MFLAAGAFRAAAGAPPFTPPASPRAIYNFNPGWKFIREDVANAQQMDCDDSAWASVSAPHTYNDTDSYQGLIDHGGGDRHAYAGIAWYRKHFSLPAKAAGGKVFLEFEGLKQAGRFWVNGKLAGKYENGITPCGLDLTGLVNFGGADNLIAVKVDNSNNYKEESGAEFEWMGRAFNPNYGGLNHDIRLILTGTVYQTLPVYENLKTTGLYIVPSHFSIAGKSCDLSIQSQVRNESGAPQSITLSALVVDAGGVVRARFHGEASDVEDGQTETLTAAGPLASARFWDVSDPYLYDVYTILKVNHKVVDVCRTRTGFRKAEFKGGAGRGGVWLNDHFVWLTGFAQRAADDWAGLGQAYPDWMHDFNAALVGSTHANYIRWMHISPQRADVSACDKAGLIQVCPAGDKEKDAQGVQWDQRMEVMRDSIIFYRNTPSIFFWEAGNTVITPDHMRQMVALRQQWDPGGGRVMGTRGDSDVPANTALTPIAEYYGVMIGQDPRTDRLSGNTDMFRAYSAERRDKAPLIETEDFRDEAARRFWDDYSPPHFGFQPGPKDTYHWNSETFCLAAAARYHDYFINRISNPDPAHSKWSGYASIYWSDSNADGRQDSSEVCRVSGKVDSVRLPKQAYYVYRVMQNDQPDIHIIGHWNYPSNTVKTIFVAASHCDAVELLLNDKPFAPPEYGRFGKHPLANPVKGKSLGVAGKPLDFVDTYENRSVNFGNTGYIFAFPQIKFEPGALKAVATRNGQTVAQDEIQTAGEPRRLRLTPHTGPNGLQADASDVAFFDIEAVDAQGRRCPTDEARVDFSLTGPATWRGGYNSGKTNSVNKLYLDTECGINRVAIRSTLTPGVITLTATRPGLEPAIARLEAKPVKLENGVIPEAP
jgi:beta-galactosidase